MTKTNRILALFLLCVIILGILVTVAVVCVHAGHHCTDEHCAICYQLKNFARNMRKITIQTQLFFVIIFGVKVFGSLFAKKFSKSHSTLITLKSKLSN